MFGSVGLAVVVGIALLVGSHEPVAFAQAQTIDFVVPSGTQVAPGQGDTDPGDTVIFTGRAKFVTSAGTCAAPGQYPVQDAVVIDPGTGQRPTRLTSLIVVSQTASVEPGTKLVNLQTLPQCQSTDATIAYDRYRGTVQ
jgi:hypothetical protein